MLSCTLLTAIFVVHSICSLLFSRSSLCFPIRCLYFWPICCTCFFDFSLSCSWWSYGFFQVFSMFCFLSSFCSQDTLHCLWKTICLERYLFRVIAIFRRETPSKWFRGLCLCLSLLLFLQMDVYSIIYSFMFFEVDEFLAVHPMLIFLRGPIISSSLRSNVDCQPEIMVGAMLTMQTGKTENNWF